MQCEEKVMSTKLLVHSDDAFLVRGLESILGRNGGFSILRSCGSVTALWEAITVRAPDVVLLELHPDVTFDFLSRLKRNTSCKLVLWVDAISPELAFQAMAVGVRGILRKSLSPKLQLECLRKVSAGEVWFEKVLVDAARAANLAALTPRERQVLRLLAQGLKNSEIAIRLAVSEGTVKAHLTGLFQKVGAKDRFELALFGLKNSVGGQWTAGQIEQHTCAVS